MVGILQRVCANPVTPVALGAAVAFAGTGYIVRSGVVFLCWIWFSANIGRMVYAQPWQRHEKSISFVFLSSIALVIAMLSIWWFLKVYVERGAH